MSLLWDLYLTFAKIGVCTFGGGLTMLPLLEAEIVESKKWATEEELLNYYAIGQCTPGIIAINVATFIGNKKKGIVGGIVATLGMVTPSLVIITLIASFLTNFAEMELVQNAFGAVRVCVSVLILNTVIKMGKTTIKNKLGIVMAIFAFIIIFFFGASPIIVVICSGIFGLILPYLKGGSVK